MSNCQEFVDLLLAAQFLGACPVPINARYKAKELGYVIADADLKMLVTTDRIVEHVNFVSRYSTEAFPELAHQQATRMQVGDGIGARTCARSCSSANASPNGMVGLGSLPRRRSPTYEAAVDRSSTALGWPCETSP